MHTYIDNVRSQAADKTRDNPKANVTDQTTATLQQLNISKVQTRLILAGLDSILVATFTSSNVYSGTAV